MTESLDFFVRHTEENRRIIFTNRNYNTSAPDDLYAKEE